MNNEIDENRRNPRRRTSTPQHMDDERTLSNPLEENLEQITKSLGWGLHNLAAHLDDENWSKEGSDPDQLKRDAVFKVMKYVLALVKFAQAGQHENEELRRDVRELQHEMRGMKKEVEDLWGDDGS